MTSGDLDDDDDDLGFNTRTGGGGADFAPSPPIFPGYLKNGVAQRRRFWNTCLEFNNTSRVTFFLTPRSIGQVTTSGQSRNITLAPASKFKVALWAQF